MCFIVLSIVIFSGCGARFVLVAGHPDVTNTDYSVAREKCIALTNGEKYSKRFRFVPGAVAPDNAPRTNAGSRYAECMEANGFVCLNCSRTFMPQPIQYTGPAPNQTPATGPTSPGIPERPQQ